MNAVSSRPSNLVELLPCPALLLSAGRTILDANGLLRELLGYPEDELVQRPLADIAIRCEPVTMAALRSIL